MRVFILFLGLLFLAACSTMYPPYPTEPYEFRVEDFPSHPPLEQRNFMNPTALFFLDMADDVIFILLTGEQPPTQLKFRR